MQEKRLFTVIKFLAVFGIFLALYLLWQQFFHPTIHPCSINQTINCDAIISGAVSKTLGIPTPLIGLIGYIVILLSALFRRKNILLGMTLFGLAFCLWIAYRELVGLHVICPVCILCQVDMLTVSILAVMVKHR